MATKDELVIRWLEEPADAACALCKSDKKKKFKNGPVVSLVSGGLVCPRCAAKNNKNLWNVCSSYARYLIERNWEPPIDDLQLGDLNLEEPIIPETYDTEFLKIDKYNDLHVPEYEPIFNEVDKCLRCANTFQPKNDPKSNK
jgi:hypothetical protein